METSEFIQGRTFIMLILPKTTQVCNPKGKPTAGQDIPFTIIILGQYVMNIFSTNFTDIHVQRYKKKKHKNVLYSNSSKTDHVK